MGLDSVSNPKKKIVSKKVIKKRKKGTISSKTAPIPKPKKTMKKGKKVEDEVLLEEKHHMPTPKIKKEISEKQISEQREPIKEKIDNADHPKKKSGRKYIKTGIQGLDDLFAKGIPGGASMIVAGGTGSGKTILCLQILAHHARNGKNCLYMSFEESENHLIEHMEDFGWNPRELIKKGTLKIQRFNPFDITRSVDALLMEAKGELLIDVDPVILPEGFKPDFLVIDSLTAIASAFTRREDSYRIYIEQLFRFLEKINATSLLITETKQIPTVFSQSGVEEFLADGVLVLYAIKRGNVRENAIEVLKLRGAEHEKRIVAMQITEKGINIYPELEMFGEVKNSN